jgi:chromosome segregation ATPase
MSDFQNSANVLRKLAEPVLKAAEAMEQAFAAQNAAREGRERQAAALAAATEAEARVHAAEEKLGEIAAAQDKMVLAFKADEKARKVALAASLEVTRCKAADAVKAEIDRLEKDRKELADKLPGLKAEVVALATEHDRLKKAVGTLKSAIASV